MSAELSGISTGPCAKIFLAVFGGLFLIALLSVPVTTRTSELRRDPGSNVIFKTTYPRKATMFLPRYLSVRAKGPGAGAVRLRPAQWLATLAIIAFLGFLDYFLVCRVLIRTRRVPPPLDGP
jgi:hypothetical protein